MSLGIGRPDPAGPARHPGWRWAWAAVACVVYPAAVGVALAAGRPRLALAATCGVFGLAFLPQARLRPLALLLLVAALVLPFAAAAEAAGPLVYLPPVLLNLAAAAWFGASLRRGREPLIGTFARLERGTLEPDLAQYTRRLTLVWCAWFVVAALLAAALAVAGPLAAWAAFAAFGGQAGALLLFLGEWLYRQRRFPQYRHASPLAQARIVAAHLRNAAPDTVGGAR